MELCSFNKVNARSLITMKKRVSKVLRAALCLYCCWPSPTASTAAFVFQRPQPGSRRNNSIVFSSRDVVSRSRAGAAVRRFAVEEATTTSTNDLHEFDYLLQEGGQHAQQQQQQQPIASSRRRIVIGQGDRATVLASSTNTFAAPAAEEEKLQQQQQQQQQQVTTEEEGASAAENTYESDPYADALDSQLGKIHQYQEKQAQPAARGIEDRLKTMDLQDIVFTFFIPAVCLFAAGRWGYNRVSGRVMGKLDATLDSFARELVYHDGDFDEMRLCVEDYGRRLVWLGPSKSETMLKRYLEAFAKKKTVSPQAIGSLSYVFTLFKLSEERAANILVTLCRQMGTDKIASAGKLLFFGSRILKSPEGKAALNPIKDLIKSTYRDATVAETLVETSQQAIAEASYRTAVQSGGKDQQTLTLGWEVLGLDRETAERIYDEEAEEGFVTAREAMYGGQAQKYDKKGRLIDKEGKLVNPEDADKDDDGEDDESGGGGPVSNVYECGECGYTLFVAQGRESKFFGDSFKCPECGAPKDRFKAREDMDD